MKFKSDVSYPLSYNSCNGIGQTAIKRGHRNDVQADLWFQIGHYGNSCKIVQTISHTASAIYYVVVLTAASNAIKYWLPWLFK